MIGIVAPLPCGCAARPPGGTPPAACPPALGARAAGALAYTTLALPVPPSSAARGSGHGAAHGGLPRRAGLDAL